jgi:hypothetical protein
MLLGDFSSKFKLIVAKNGFKNYIFYPINWFRKNRKREISLKTEELSFFKIKEKDDGIYFYQFIY